MAMLIVDGVAVKSPSSFTWGLQDVSDSESGRTMDAIMHKNRIAQKRKINLEWWGLRPEDAAKVLQAFNPEYIMVTYPDAMSGTDETREFYVGDRSAPVQQWFVGGKLYSKITLNIIER